MRLLIIGGGPAGYTAAFEAAARGMAVTLVEKGSIGGICLNHGCIPTKSLRSSADALELARRIFEYGITGCVDPVADLPAINRRKDNIIKVLRGGLLKTASALGVELISGQASIIGEKTISVDTAQGRQNINGDAILVATGSSGLNLPGLPVDHQYILNSSDALELEKAPERLLIVGGGVIGCELACIYRAFGSEVSIVEAQERLLPMPSVDFDVSAWLAREMRKRKIGIHLCAAIREARVENGFVKAALGPSPLADVKNSQPESELEADMVFVTVGRMPNATGLGLEKAGIVQDKSGWIEVNGQLRTSAPDIYAAGDILGQDHVMLAHVAEAEALCVIDNLCGKNRKMDYRVVPAAIFTQPEIGCVGLTEQQARARYANVVCATSQMRELGKAHAMGEISGFFKIIANGGTGEVLGMQIAGAHASDILAEATLALQKSLHVDELAVTIHAHPTLAEGIWETARKIKFKLDKQGE